MDELSIEIEPNNLLFSYETRTNHIKLQNLTIQYVWVTIISPNPFLFSFSKTQGIYCYLTFSKALIDPCSEIDLEVNLNIWPQSNLNSLTYN